MGSTCSAKHDAYRVALNPCENPRREILWDQWVDECRHPGCDIVLSLCKALPPGEMTHGVSICYFLQPYLHLQQSHNVKYN